MKILFDASNLFSYRGGGVYNYLMKLLPLLIQKVEQEGDEISFLRLYFRKGVIKNPPFVEGKKISSFRFPIKLLNYLWIKYKFPDFSRFYKNVDIVHSPHFSLPLMSKAKKILTVNDITYLKHPEYFSPSGKNLNDYGYKFLLPANIWRADKIIAISQHTKKDIVEYFGIPEDKVSVVYIGCDSPCMQEARELSGHLKEFGLDRIKYVYFPVGTFEPRKNMAKTILAFNKTNPKPGRIKLVVSGVGDRSWLTSKVSTEDVIFVKWNSDDTKNALYQGSLFVIYPSLYEGFGMPVVEAMGNGRAVLTSNNTSLMEIADGYACIVDSENEGSISQGMKRLFEDTDYRLELERKARIRARDFTWEKMVEQTYDIYNGI
jgi:glycosyltransferase involved in cell wall biosynthesis